MLLTPEMIDMMLDSFIETLIMVGIAGVIGGAIGIPLGILLHVTSPQGILSAKVFNRTIGVLVNAVPFYPVHHPARRHSAAHAPDRWHVYRHLRRSRAADDRGRSDDLASRGIEPA